MDDVRLTVLDQLDQLEEVVLEGSRLPFTGGRLVNEGDAVEVLDAVREALPKEIERAGKLIERRDDFINTARRQAEEIVQQAQRQREQLVNSAAIRQEAERQVNDLRDQTRQQCEQLLQTTRQQGARFEQEVQAKIAEQEQIFSARRQQLEQEALQRRQELEQEVVELRRQAAEQHDINRAQALKDLEAIRNEGLRLQKEGHAEAERIHNDSLQFRQQTQQQCEALIHRSRQEAAGVQDGANRYAEQTLGELEARLKDMAQIVIGGRQELVKIQSIRSDLGSKQSNPAQAAAPIIRGRRSSSRFRSMKGNG